MANHSRTTGFSGAGIAVLAMIVEYVFPTAEPWLTGLLILLLVGLISMSVAFWIVERGGGQSAAEVGQHFHNSTVYINQIAPELAAINPHGGGNAGSVVVAQPDGAPPQAPPTIVGQVSIAEETDTLIAGGQIFLPTVRAISPLFVGQIIISASQLAGGSLEIAVRAFNGSRETIELDSVHGAILAGIGNANGAGLPTPTLRPEHTVPPIPPGTEFMVVLDQPIPGQLAEQYLAALEKGDYIALDFRALQVRVRAGDDANLSAPLPLWHGATIRRGHDISTGRMYIASLEGQAVTVNAAQSHGGDSNS